MENFCIRLAGTVIGVSAEFSETKTYCKEFLTEEGPDCEIVLTEQDRKCAGHVHMKTDLQEGRVPGRYPDTMLENTALHMRVMDELIRYGAVLFHGCAVAVNGRVYLFCADSGTGKTTHARLWLENIPGCHILNGDKPVLTFRDGEVLACGTPWRGKEKFGTDEILPLAGICLLERAAENRIEQIPFSEAFSHLIRHSHRPGDPADLLPYMRLIQKLMPVPVYRLGCNLEDGAALVAYHGMVKDCAARETGPAD